MTIDASLDFTVFDNTEAVTVVLKGIGGGEKIAIANALKRSVSRGETLSSGGYLTGQETVFNIPASQLGTDKKLREGNQIITTDGQCFRIRTAGLVTWETRWRATCTLEKN